MNNDVIIKPKRHKDLSIWQQHDVPKDFTLGFYAEGWSHANGLFVISSVEVVKDDDGIDKGPEYHLSISKNKMRCDANEAAWVIDQFDLYGSEEDNHVPNGFVRNFWRPVAENLIGIECQCKANEPAMREDKGDFVWRGI